MLSNDQRLELLRQLEEKFGTENLDQFLRSNTKLKNEIIDENFSDLDGSDLENSEDATLHFENLNKEIQDNSRVATDAKLLEDLHFAYSGISNLVNKFNQEFKGLITLDDTAIQASLKDSLHSQRAISRNLVRNSEGKVKGLLRAPSVEIILAKLKRILTQFISIQHDITRGILPNKKTLKELISGVMQIGKTQGFTGLFLLLSPMIYVLTKGRILPIAFLTVPNFKSILKSTILDLEGGKQLFGQLIIRCGDFSCSVNQFWDIEIKAKNPDVFTRNGNILSLSQALITLRTKSSLKIRENIIKFFKTGCNFVLMFNDECHWGSQGEVTNKNGETTRGILDQLMSPIIIENEIIPIHEIAISATADEILSEEIKREWNIDHTRMGPNYVGFSYFHGEKIPTIGCDGPIAEPQVVSMDSYLNNLKMDQEAYFDLNTFKKNILYLKKSSAEWEIDSKWEDLWKDYKQDFIKKLARICSKRLDSNRKAICFRLLTNPRCVEIKNHLAEILDLDKGFSFVNFYGDGVTSIQEQCKPILDQNKYAIIFATANARMSNEFPGWCHTIVDFTRATSTGCSLFQGSIGRLCGYDKLIDGQPPLVLVRPEVKQEYENVKASKFKLGAHKKKPGQHTRKAPSANKGPRASHNCILNVFHSIYPEIREKSSQFNECLKMCGGLTQSIPLSQDEKITLPNGLKVRPSLFLNTMFKDVIFPNEFLQNLHNYLGPSRQHYKGQILLYGEEEQSRTYGPQPPSISCKRGCKKVGKNCEGHAAFKFDLKNYKNYEETSDDPPGSRNLNAINVGFTTTVLPPNWFYKKLYGEDTEFDMTERRPGAGNANRSAPKQKMKFGDKQRYLPPAIVIKLANENCPDCHRDIEECLWSIYLKYLQKKGSTKIQGNWLTDIPEIKNSCCFKHRNFELLIAIFRTREPCKPLSSVGDSFEEEEKENATHIHKSSRHMNEDDEVENEELIYFEDE